MSPEERDKISAANPVFAAYWVVPGCMPEGRENNVEALNSAYGDNFLQLRGYVHGLYIASVHAYTKRLESVNMEHVMFWAAEQRRAEEELHNKELFVPKWATLGCAVLILSTAVIIVERSAVQITRARSAVVLTDDTDSGKELLRSLGESREKHNRARRHQRRTQEEGSDKV